jgi:hypothetical protein
MRAVCKQIFVMLEIISLLAIIIGLQYGREQLLAPAMGQTLCHAKGIYWETRSQSFDGMWAASYVMHNRAKANRSYWGGKTLCGVVYQIDDKTAQFSWVLDRELTKREPSSFEDKTAWQMSVLAARLVEWTGYSLRGFEEATSYMNPSIADPKQRCWFYEHLVSLGFVGDHEFFREPHEGEVITFKCKETPVVKNVSAKKEKTVPIPVPRPA